MNVTIYYPEKSITWNISNFDPLGAKDIRFVPLNPIEEIEEEKEEEIEEEKENAEEEKEE